MRVINSALTSNVVTLTVQITSGEIPAIGSFISVSKTANGSGVMNVNRAVITGVVINATTGAGTITYALTNSNITSAADSGSAVAEVPEVGESMTVAGSSAACVIQAPEGDSQFTVSTSVTFSGALPTAVTVTLQRAIKNIDSEFTNVGNAAVISAGAYTTGPNAIFTLERGFVYRFNASGLTGTGTIIAKLA
jgi:hypothetical protein